MKAVKIILIEVLILIIITGAGFGLDYLMFFGAEPKPDAAGHAVPVFIMILPVITLIVMAIVNLVLIITAIVRKQKNGDKITH